jgi:hypothetical protein
MVFVNNAYNLMRRCLPGDIDDARFKNDGFIQCILMSFSMALFDVFFHQLRQYESFFKHSIMILCPHSVFYECCPSLKEVNY